MKNNEAKSLKLLVESDTYLSKVMDVNKIPSDLTIRGVTANSTLCRKGFLFIAVPKALDASRGGHEFFDDAISNGASSIVADAIHVDVSELPTVLVGGAIDQHVRITLKTEADRPAPPCA